MIIVTANVTLTRLIINLVHKLKYSALLLLFVATGHTQNFYLIDSLFSLTTGELTRSVIDLNTCDRSTVITEYNPTGIPIYAPDMTITGDVSVPGTPVALMFSGADNDPTPNGVLILNYVIPVGSPFIGPIFSEPNPKAISSNYNRVSYLLGDFLTLVDGINQTTDYIATIPVDMRPKGQMTFRESSFYYPSVNNELIQLKIADNNYWMRSLGNLPDTLSYAGIFSIPHSCDSTTTYVLHLDPDRGGDIFTLDIQSVTLTPYCEMIYKPVSAVFEGENTLPPCNYELDLASNDPGEINRYDSLCAGTIALLDADISLLPNMEFDSITATILNPLDGNEEWLSISATHPEVLNSGNDTHQVTMASTGFTRGDALLSVLSSLSYTNNASTPTPIQRTIEVSVHHPFYGIISANIWVDFEGTLNIVPILQQPSCFGFSDGSIQLDITGDPPNYDINWEDNSMSVERLNLSIGSYNYHIIDENGCQYIDTLLLEQPDTLTLSITATLDTICGDTGSLTAIPTGGTADYTYNWDSGGQVPNEDMLSAGTYNLTVLDANDCPAMATYTLFEADTLFSNLAQDDCLGNPISLNGETYTQDTSFQSFFTTLDGCDSLLDVQLSFFDTFYSFTAFEICPGEAVNLYDLFIENDTSFQVNFQTVNGCDSLEYYEVSLLSAPLTSSLASICSGETYSFAGQMLTTSGIYYDTLTASSGCDSLLELNLTVHPLPEPDIIQMGSICSSGSTTLNTNENYPNILWNTGVQGSSIEVNTAGNYTLSVTDANGCMNSTMISLTDDPPIVDFSLIQPPCPDGQGQLMLTNLSGGSPPYQILETGQIVSAGDTINNLTSAAYTYTISDAANCVSEINFDVIPENTLEIILPEVVSIKLGESFILPLNIGFQPTTINWSPPLGLDCTNCPNPLASPTETTSYMVSLADDQGCSWQGSTLVEVEYLGIYIPNIFSPNEDGVNDVFHAFPSVSVKSVRSLIVYNRWGGEVFFSTAASPSWNGTVNGQLAEAGTYVYALEWEDFAGNKHSEKGEVVLVR